MSDTDQIVTERARTGEVDAMESERSVSSVDGATEGRSE